MIPVKMGGRIERERERFTGGGSARTTKLEAQRLISPVSLVGVSMDGSPSCSSAEMPSVASGLDQEPLAWGSPLGLCLVQLGLSLPWPS